MESTEQNTKTVCDRCGLESGLEEAFTKRRLAWIGPARTTCPNCERDRQLRSALFGYVLLPVTALLAYTIRPSLTETRWLVGTTLVLLLGIPLAVLHELAHVFAARALGGSVLSVTIGFGRGLLSWRLLGVFWDVRQIPIGGITRIAIRQERLLRLRTWLVYAAGPGLHLLLALLAWMTWLAALLGGAGRGVPFWASVLFYANLLPLLVNLLPIQVSTQFGVTGSDGWHMLKLPFLSTEEAQHLAIRNRVGAAVIATRHKQFEEAERLFEMAEAMAPSDPEIANALGFLSLAQGNLAAARRAFVDALEHYDETAPGQRYLLLNNVAYVDALLEDPSLLDEADEYSSEALENAPWMPQFSGTRGAVLVARGEYAAGIELLKTAMHGADGPDAKAENASLLALAEARSGNLEQAQTYMQLARKLDPQCYLIPIVEARFPRSSQVPEHPRDRIPPALREARLTGPTATRHWLLAPETFALISGVWGFWNLLANQSFTIGPGIAFLLLAAVIAWVPHPQTITSLGLALAWIGLLDVVGGGMGPTAYGVLNGLLAALLFTFRRHWSARASDRPLSQVEDGKLPPLGHGLPLLSAITGTSAAFILLALLLLLLATAVGHAASAPANQLDGYSERYGQLFLVWYLVEPLALVGAVTGLVAIANKAQRRWIGVMGLGLTTPILLIDLALALLDRFF